MLADLLSPTGPLRSVDGSTRGALIGALTVKLTPAVDRRLLAETHERAVWVLRTELGREEDHGAAPSVGALDDVDGAIADRGCGGVCASPLAPPATITVTQGWGLAASDQSVVTMTG